MRRANVVDGLCSKRSVRAIFLTQGETRKTKRVRLFTEFVSRRLGAYAPLLAGLSLSHD